MSDDLNFLDDLEDKPAQQCRWKVLIVDDDSDVHNATKFALSGLEINHCLIEWLDAYSGSECVELLQKGDNIDLIILDVVMETPTAGLDAAKKIREITGKNNIPVIILRSGQAAQLTEKELFNNPDINTFIPKQKATREVLKSLLESYLT